MVDNGDFQNWSKYVPILEWGTRYNGELLSRDMMAALVVTVLLIPQSLAYAMLAGLPPQIGLFASMLPLIAYAVFGTSNSLAVGPVAIISLMTAAAASRVAAPGSTEYLQAAIALATMSGAILFVMGILKMGFLANFLSQPVISGFISACAVLIAASQLKHILGVDADGHSLIEMGESLLSHVADVNIVTLSIGLVSLALLVLLRRYVRSVLENCGLPIKAANLMARASPVYVIILSITSVVALGDIAHEVRVLGDVPNAIPSLSIPAMHLDTWRELLLSAVLLSLVGFVESVSVARKLGAKRRESVDANQELIGLGSANLAAGLSSGYPVTGGIARSAVNFDAGAATPAAGAFTAIGIGVATIFLTPVLFYLPHAVLAATIIVSVFALVDLTEIQRVWRYSKADFASMCATIFVTLLFGVELGIATGISLSVLLHLYNTSRPHFALVGLVPGTHHYRNVNRHAVLASERVLTIRIDESLYFANAHFLAETIYCVMANRPDMKHLILMCPAVNHIDASGLDSLEMVNNRLRDAGVTLHLSEVKGPVMDRLKRSDFLARLSGNVYLNQYAAMHDLDREVIDAAGANSRLQTNPDSTPCPSELIAGIARRK